MWLPKLSKYDIQIIGLFVVLATSPVMGFQIEGLPFELEAENVIYNNNTNQLDASKKVVLSYENNIITSDSFSYSEQKRNLSLKGNVSIQSSSGSIYSDQFNYNFASKKGKSKNIKSQFKKVLITGDSLEINEKKSVIKNCKLSTCNKKTPHYKIKSKQIELYPDTGDIVLRNNTILLYETPIFYIPTYVYNAKTSQIEALQRTKEPFPDFGFNRVDGNYFKINYAYFLSPYESGTISIGTSSKRGFLYGVNHRQTLSAFQRLYIKAYSVNKTGLEGGLIYEQDLFQGKEKSSGLLENALSPFISNKEKTTSTLLIQGLHNEIINYQLVSFLPLIEIKTTNILMPFNLNLNSRIGGGTIKDEKAKSERYHLDHSLGKTIALSKSLSLKNSLLSKVFFYKDNKKLSQLFNKSSINFEKEENNYELSYSKKLIYHGESPFRFDTENTISSDEIGFKVKQSLSALILTLEGDYSVPNKKMRNLTYGVGINIHCWQMVFNYNTVWEEFNLGFSLLKSY